MTERQQQALRIVSSAEQLTEGLFGQVLLYVFEVLPFLFERKIFPDWRIHARHYGFGTSNLVVPGVLDLAYEVLPEPATIMQFTDVRRSCCSVLGNDWVGLNRIWNSYFRIPKRFEEYARIIGPLSNTLGVHYRGTDKLLATWDTNAVSHAEFLAVIQDALRRHPQLSRVYLATDDNSFCTFLRGNLAVPVTNQGPVPFHKAPISQELIGIKTDRAMLDCLMLSRCSLVLLSSSALSGFSKIINPDLNIFRISASKKFADIPYFPVAYLPVYDSPDARIQQLIAHLTQGDWSHAPESQRFKTAFTYMSRFAQR
jgi:hypothetical protein